MTREYEIEILRKALQNKITCYLVLIDGIWELLHYVDFWNLQWSTKEDLIYHRISPSDYSTLEDPEFNSADLREFLEVTKKACARVRTERPDDILNYIQVVPADRTCTS